MEGWIERKGVYLPLAVAVALSLPLPFIVKKAKEPLPTR